MYSLRTVIIVLVVATTLWIGFDLIVDSEEFKQGKVNLIYLAAAFISSMIGIIFFTFVLMFIKKVWPLL